MEKFRSSPAEEQTSLESRLRLVIDTIPEQVWSALPDGSVDFLNQRWLEYTGLSLSEGLGFGVRGTVHSDDLAPVLDEWNKSVASGGAFHKEARIRRADGEYRWFLLRAEPLRDESGNVVKWYGTSVDIEDQKQAEQLRIVSAEQALERTALRLAVQSAVLTDLTATQASGSVAFDARLSALLESCAQTLQVQRVSVWQFSEDRSTIHCVDLYESKSSSHSSGLLLARETYPQYFDALERERLIAAGDALIDPRTSEFADDYLQPNGIGAMLDVPLRQDKVTAGVLCLEHVGNRREWSTDERNFALSVANLVAAATADENRRAALRRLAESEKTARLVVDTAHDAFIGMGTDGRIVAWNASAEETFGWKREEVIGHPLAETIIPPAYREAHLKGLQRFLESGDAPVAGRLLELSAIHRSGHEFPIEITITKPITREDGSYYFGAFLRDISDRLRREQELRQAKNSAEAATRAKSEFLANMSHELRTPLNGVLGYAQVLKRDRDLTTSQEEAIDAIAQSGTHLLNLINDVLDLSKIEAGKMELEAVATNLQQLVGDVRQMVAESARQKGLELEVQLAADLPRLVALDGRHVRQVLINLLGNAVKFTNSGSILLTIVRKNGRLRFEVSDTGIGIEPEDLRLIFAAFTQARSGVEEGGTGLGLTISQRLVRAMGGDLSVTSKPGVGSQFSFDVPLNVVEQSIEAVAPTTGDDFSADKRLVSDQDITALVVDDHSINRRIMALLLQGIGVHTMTAADGLEGIELARKVRPEVIFMDLRMKGINGIEATRRLHADAVTASIPVVAVTASPLDEDRKAALAAGCREFLSKPVRAVDLIRALERQVGARFERVTSESVKGQWRVPKSHA